ncbi:LPS export ABC transporter periplasmic protein LptC [Niastella caeni]|uniref:LPS export ABC transporter periplasmic protein LptC n=1 Tax=Niastella caeni TaxID=2569763 RepID=A0A4S8I4Q4_9BACT|nr:LPS export ABC transporter periplasmic protein LptC [Niastella caeni]THU41722.1 LPS export ABC transporter periplasmic protein LptC [Niastella caeni]
MRSTSITYYFFAAALLLGCFFVFTSCENDQNVVDQLFQKKVAVEEAKKIESYLSQSGKVKAKLTAPYMLRVQGQSPADSPYMEFPHSLHVDFYDDSTIIESTLDARYAKYVEFDRKVLLRDSVLVVSIKNGDTLRTQELWWDQDKQEFHTNKPAHVYQRDKIIFAKDGLRASQNLTSYTFYSSSGPMLVPNSGLPQ